MSIRVPAVWKVAYCLMKSQLRPVHRNLQGGGGIGEANSTSFLYLGGEVLVNSSQAKYRRWELRP